MRGLCRPPAYEYALKTKPRRKAAWFCLVNFDLSGRGTLRELFEKSSLRTLKNFCCKQYGLVFATHKRICENYACSDVGVILRPSATAVNAPKAIAPKRKRAFFVGVLAWRWRNAASRLSVPKWREVLANQFSKSFGQAFSKACGAWGRAPHKSQLNFKLFKK